jgi:hypothetical protein
MIHITYNKVTATEKLKDMTELYEAHRYTLCVWCRFYNGNVTDASKE